MKGQLKAHLVLLLTTIIGGFNFSIPKLIMPQFVQPAALIIIRGISGVVFFWLVHLFVRENIKEKKDYYKLFICSLFGIAGNQLLFYSGLNLTTPINASLLQCAIPVFVLMLSVTMAREKITILKLSGLMIGATGAILLLIDSSKSQVTSSHIGDLLVILNSASYAVFLVLVKPLSEKYNPFTIMKWLFLFGTLITLPFGYNQLQEVRWDSLPSFVWLCLGYIVLFATIANYYLNVGVLRFVNPSIAGIYMYLVPVFATLVAVFLDQDEVTVPKLGYSLLILFGVYMVSKKSDSKKTTAK